MGAASACACGALQERTGGLTEFVPLPFVPMETPIYLHGRARSGPTYREAILMHAVARLALHPHVTNIQTSWVKMGPQGVKACLDAGANDLGGTLMNESITRAAGAVHGEELPPAEMEALIASIGRQPAQRTTLYEDVAPERRAASFAAAPLAAPILTPAHRYEREQPKSAVPPRRAKKFAHENRHRMSGRDNSHADQGGYVMMLHLRRLRNAALVGLGVLAASTLAATADDTLKIAVGQRGSWDTSVSELGQKAGIFKKHGLELDLLFTQGAGETQQATISGSVDVGIGGGVMGVLGAFEKGAPIRVIGTEINSAGDYWYVPAASPIKTIRDANGATMAFSTVGSSTQAIVLAIIKEYGLTAAKPVATGGPPPTFTQVMSGQIDVGWATPPFGIQALEEGKIRIIARGNDIPEIRNQTNRLLITSASVLERRKAAIERYMDAYRETVAYMYADPMALKYYAEIASVPESLAKRVRDEFFTKEMLMPDKVIGMDIIMPAAVTLKYLAAPIPDDKLKALFQIPPPRRRREW